ncbi:MAG: hypothetical protein AAGA54_30205 [Myxococcota bacterium]
MWRLGCALVALALGCSFETGSEVGATGVTEAAPEPGGSTSGESSTGTSGEDPGMTGPEPGTTALPDGTTAPATTNPEGSTGPGPVTTTTDDSAESGEPASSSGEDERPVDCSDAVVLSRTVDDAELFEPMMLGTHLDVDYAYSDSLNAGAIRFTFEVECPSLYRMFARVRDDVPGVNNCCDPDSFEVEAPGQSGDWFYGCDTLGAPAGFSWQPVEFPTGTTCDQTELVLLDLSPGIHEITLRNRESNYFEARAGVAEFILTNDPTFSP